MVRGPEQLMNNPGGRSASGRLRRMGLWLFSMLALWLMLASAPAPGLAQGKPVPRDILALYDGREDAGLAYMELHRMVQTVLEHLGLKVTYRDITQKKLPGPREMERYRGTVVQFISHKLPRAEAFLKWIMREIKSGRKVVLLGDLGPSHEAAGGKRLASELIQTYNAALGFKSTGFYTETPALLTYGPGKAPARNFERRLPAFPPVHPGYAANAEGHEALISVRHKSNPESDCPVVCLTPFGGVAWEPYYLYRKKGSGFSQWYIDPFYFFGRAFNTAGMPKPDVSTLSGRRVWYNHIDGDALLSMSHIKKGATCGAVVRDELLKKEDLPFTVSVITCEVDPKAQGKQKVVDLARSIFALPNVEPASHTFSHPFHWLKAIASAKGGESADDEADLPYGHSIKVPGYKFSLEKEIKGSAEYISQSLAPSGKPCRIILWSGNCRPPAEAIAMAEDMGLAQMNGGDSIFDNTRPSITGVAPLGLPVGDRFQVYTSMANENIYTNLWSGPYWGQRRVVQTFERTGRPRRLRPINLYFHFYAGERLAALNALRYAVKWARKQPTSPIYASHYYRLVQGFLSTRISRLGDGVWKIEDHGDLRSIRFDHCRQKVDMQRSKNVQGFSYYGDSLYVHIGAGAAEICLGADAPDLPYLAEASGLIEGWNCQPGRVTFVYRGWGQGPVILAGLPPRARPRIAGPGWKAVGPVDAQGRLELKGPADVKVSVNW